MRKRIREIMKMEIYEKETFDLSEAAQYLKIDVKSVKYYAKRAKELSYSPIGKGLVFTKKDLDQFISFKKKGGISSLEVHD